MFLGANPFSWSSTKQRTIARSSTEVEYRAIVNVATEIQWVKSLLVELLQLVSTTPTLTIKKHAFPRDNLGTN